MFQGGALVGIGTLLSRGFSLVRNIIVARHVSVADFGIAATFVIIVTLIEMISDVGIGTLVVQSEDGDDPEFLGTSHLINVFRGVMNSAVLFACAYPLALVFGAPEATWAFRWLALYPLLKNISHIDISRVQREMRFWPQTISDISSQLLATIVAWPLAAWLHSYSALLWLILIQRGAASVASFILATRPYQLKWSAKYAKRIFAFGWPLLFTGIVMFCVLQGDRVVIGTASRIFSRAHYTMKDLGRYSAAFTLTLVLGSGLNSIVTSLLLPLLSQAKADPERFARRYAVCVQSLAFFGGALGILFILGGKPIIVLLYKNEEYLGAAAFMGWLGSTQALRLIRAASTVTAIAKGDTTNSLVSNIVRASSLVGVFIVAAYGGSIVLMCVCALVAEVMALTVSMIQLHIQHKISIWSGIGPTAVAGAAMLLAAATVGTGISVKMAPAIAACVIETMILTVVSAIVFPGLRRELQLLASRWLRSNPA
jgi:O-antigen/teichoic acid export membrane protein